MLWQVAWCVGDPFLARAEFVDDLLQLRDHLVPLLAQGLQDVAQPLRELAVQHRVFIGVLADV
ncbi:hypothetical protein D3C73_725820 [compost metagenome]